MKFALVFLIFGATTAQSDSFCGVTDEAAVLDALQGHWVRAGATSIESVSISEVSPVSWPAEFGRTGEVDAWEVTTAFAISDVVLGFDGPIYDVDGVDDILETTGSEWIADAVSLTPCGPDGLLQPTADFAFDELVTGQVTVIPYFSDSMLMIVEARLRGDFGVAFITTSTLMTRD